ncbi:MAG: CRTAC1 family protein [Planctomycetota bacterium]|nr:CRTAC1 family protein [Planctomycetota bacterium]
MTRSCYSSGLLACALLMSACGGGDDATPSTSKGTAQGKTASETWFSDQVNASGITFTHVSGHEDDFYIPEIMAGGVALFDMDSDGDLDVYFVQGGSLIDPASNPPNQLYENMGDGRFQDVTEASGTGDRGYGIGVATGDYNNDGHIDLLVTNVGRNTLYRNDGSGTFTDVSEKAGLDAEAYSASASFFDADQDGDLDLYVCNYLVNWTPERELECKNTLNQRDYCAPTAYKAPAPDHFYRNDGNGQFTDMSSESGIAAVPGTGLGVVAADFTGNGQLDVFVANDGMADRLWVRQPDGTYQDQALVAGCAMDMSGKAKAGMGVSVADLDEDQDQDLIVCNLWRETDSLYLNDGRGMFQDATIRTGLAATPKTFTRFGLGFVDFDNDGYLDLYEANGRVARLARNHADDHYAEPNILFRGEAGPRFVEVMPRGGTSEPLISTSRGAAFGDLDNDGRLDIIVINRDAQPHVLRNVVTDAGNWSQVRVLDKNGRDALGARVHVTTGDRTLTRQVRTDGSYCAANDPRIHVGLGSAQTVDDVSVTWPDGTQQSFGPQPVNTILELRR